MLITVKRHWFTDNSTIGIMMVDRMYACFTLEDKVRGDNEPKVPSKTAIPIGEYRLTIDDSKRFKRPMPHILAVPNFEGVRIHSGNTDADTEGCILLGYSREHDKIFDSRKAFDDFFAKLDAAIKRNEPVTIEILNEPL